MSQQQEYVVRVPSEMNKSFHVMRFGAALNVDFTKWKNAKMDRENNIKEFKHEEEEPKFGAGSEFGRQQREEAKRKKYGVRSKKYNPDDQPWVLRVGGKSGKKYRGIREGGVTENASYYVFFQAPDGAFEAFPVGEWYNFAPIQRYKALTAEEAEEKFEKRDKILNYFTVMINKKKTGADGGEASTSEEKVKGKRVRNSFKVSDVDEWHADSDDDRDDDDERGSDDDVKPNIKGKNKKGTKKPNAQKKKKKKGSDDDDDSEPLEESDEGDFDDKEVDYMSDSSSSEEESESEKTNRQLKGVEDEDAMRQLVLSDDDEEEEAEKERNAEENKEGSDKAANKSNAPTDKKANAKMEVDGANSGEESPPSSSDSEDDSDIDESKHLTSAMFLQQKKSLSNKPNKNGSDHSANSSRATTPTSVYVDSQASTSSPASGKSVDSNKNLSVKRKSSMTDSPAPVHKKPKAETIGYQSNGSSSSEGITEEAVRRYLMRKPMTTTELLQKLKSKKMSMSGQEFQTTIAHILKKLNPDKQQIKGKLHLFIKPS